MKTPAADFAAAPPGEPLAPEPPVRHTLPGGCVGVSDRRELLRAAAHAAVWMGAVPLAARAAGRWGARPLLHRVQRAWARGLFGALGVHLEREGEAHIEPGQAYVVVALHESFVDAPALLHLPLALRFVARDALVGWRVLGPMLRDTRQLLIRPEQGARSYRRLLREARPACAAGESLVVFAQGTILGIETELSRGAFGLARALALPILPVALTGGHRVWEHPYSPRLRYGQRVSVRVLPPIPAEQIRSTPTEALRRQVQRDLKRAALDGIMAPPRRFRPERDGFWDGFAYRIDPDFPELAARVQEHRRNRSNGAEFNVQGAT